MLATILLEKLFDFLALAVMLAVLGATTPLPDLARATGIRLRGFHSDVSLEPQTQQRIVRQALQQSRQTVVCLERDKTTSTATG